MTKSAMLLSNILMICIKNIDFTSLKSYTVYYKFT